MSLVSLFRGGSSQLRAAMKVAKETRLPLTEAAVKSHSLAGGNPVRCVEAMAFAEKNGISVQWTQICALDLTQHDPVDVLEKCVPLHEDTFETFVSSYAEPIVGHCRDGTTVRCGIAVSYRLPVAHVWGETTAALQERLATRACSYIYRSPSFGGLVGATPQHEAEMLRLGTELMPTLAAVRLVFSRA